MDEPERLPCPSCGEPAAVGARMCPHCGADLLVEVVLRAPVTDGRVRYKVARALQALPQAPPLSEIQSGLAAARPVVARDVTRGFAHAALAVLAENGLKGSIERAAPGADAPGRSSSFGGIAQGAAAAVLLLMAYTAWQQLLAKREPDVPAVAKPAEPAAKAPAAASSLSPRELAKLSLPSTVSLRCKNSVGSGFFVAKDLVLTNAHVLCPGGENIQVVLSDEAKFVGTPVRSDEQLDLALVRVVGGQGPPLRLGDVGDLAVGDKVMIIGSPVGLEFTVHEGSVSSLQRSAYGVAFVQLDAKVNPGNSGGPVIDGQGRVVAVVSLKVAGGVEGIGLALPINYAYSPEVAYVKAPAGPAASSPPFARMVARAQEESGAESRSARAAGSPADDEAGEGALLVAAYVDPYKRLVVRLVRIADARPPFEEVSLNVWKGTDNFCTIKGDVSTWTETDPTKPGAGVEAKIGQVLKRMARGRSVYVGESPLRWDLCDRTKMFAGVEVELLGGNPAANRLQLR
jgi:serine protease Do